MSEPAMVTSPHAPDVEDVRQWMEKMIKTMRLFELVMAIVALVTRMRDINTELTKRLVDLRRKRPRSETLARVQAQLAFAFAAWVVGTQAPAPTSASTAASDGSAPNKRPKRSRKGRHPGRAELPSHL